MRKAILLALLIFSALAITVYAQGQQGCCCDPVTRAGTFESQTSCMTKNFVFLGPPPNVTTTCNQMCNTTAIITPTVPAGQCGAPGYKPAPSNLAASPVKGQRSIRLSFNLLCTADYIKVFRCKGTTCTNFAEIARTAPTNTFTDSSSDLLWDQSYTYRVMAHYNVAGDSFNATATANTGDIECWGQQGTNIFCISRFFYSQELIKNYLENYGYKTLNEDAFIVNFSDSVRSTFNTLFEKSWFCNNANKLSRPSPTLDCTGGKICVSDGTAAKCVEPTACDIGGTFGMLPSIAACEGTAAAKKYCFLDKSKSIIDSCYQCNANMGCYDYHSKGACERNNCGIGQCVWKDIFPSLGMGVCYDARFDPCPSCSAAYTSNAANRDAYDAIFDVCTDEKAAALSTQAKACFYDKNQKLGKGCEFAGCTLYTQSQCGSPSGGITLNPDNSLKTISNDFCGIRVCQYSQDTGCVKNADGSTGAGWQDCFGADDPVACEKDYFPPETILYASGLKPGKHDYINIVIKDKLSKTASAREMQGHQGYKTYLCVVTATNPCNIASQFTISTNSTQLNINDLELKDGDVTVAALSSGVNIIKYYSIDKYRNIEVIGKSITISTCVGCSGPKALSISVSGARKVGDKYYTNTLQPMISVSLNEPAKIIASSFSKGSTAISFSANPASGFSNRYVFTINTPLTEGEYVFSMNAVDNSSAQMDDPVLFDLVVDTTPPTVRISPAENSEFSVGTAFIVLNFSEPVLLGGTTLDEIIFVNKVAKKAIPIELASKLKTSDNMSFSGTVSNLREGLKIIRVRATDYAFNIVPVNSSFSVITAAPQIRVKQPSWGIASSYAFDVVFETSSAATCKYIYDVPTAPAEDQFDTFSDFDLTGGIEHKLTGFNRIPFGDKTPHVFHVYCKTEKFGMSKDSFDIYVDTVAPFVVSAYAQPNPIAEPVAPNTSVYSTNLQVQTDKDGFCKYSAAKQNFNEMESVFPGFDEEPKKSHSAEVKVTQASNYTFYIACKSLAGLASPTVQVKFYVDTRIAFKVNNTTPKYAKEGMFFLRVNTNKKALCYFGEDSQAIANCFGNCSFGMGHIQQIMKPAGSHTFYVKCNTLGGETSPVIPINVTVDSTPPVMLWVNDSTTLPGAPDISWYSNKIRVRFMGYDNESAVAKYYYMLESAFAHEILVNWTPSLELKGNPVFIMSNVTDGTRYLVRVKAINLADLEGEPMASDGVTIDTTKIPPACFDGDVSEGESDYDCGGPCAGCAVGMKCNLNADCDSFFCLNGTCEATACDDGMTNGRETDVDCGGTVCDKCALEKSCGQDSDCESKKCKGAVCVIPDVCENSVLDGPESDIDCGGSCPNRCTEGQNCNLHEDCSSELGCYDNTCGVPKDLDTDNVPDNIDKCPGTLVGETVDEYGCSLAQRFTCGDEIDDAWRTKYFGSTLCTEEGSLTADIDKDKLTNVEEYRAGTSPALRDTDKDGWSDSTELSKGTNPLDKKSHPTSVFFTIIKILFILALLGGGGYGAYYGYKKGYFDKFIEQIKSKLKKAPPEALAPEIKPKPAPEKPVSMEKIAQLRKIARKKEEAPEEFISLEEARKKTEKPGLPLERLREMKKKQKLLEMKPKAGAIERLKGIKEVHPPDAISKLKKLKKAK